MLTTKIPEEKILKKNATDNFQTEYHSDTFCWNFTYTSVLILHRKKTHPNLQLDNLELDPILEKYLISNV